MSKLVKLFQLPSRTGTKLTKVKTARSSSSIEFDSAFAKAFSTSAMKNAAGHKRDWTKFVRMHPVVNESLKGIAKQMGYEVAFDLVLDLFVDVNVRMAKLDDPSLDDVWNILAEELNPSKALSRLYGGINEATDVDATDGIIYAGVIISVLAERRRRGKSIPDTDLGSGARVHSSNGKTVLSVGKKMVGTVGQMAKDPLTLSYMLVGSIGVYEGATGNSILPEDKVVIDGGIFASLASGARSVKEVLDDIGEVVGADPGNPLTQGANVGVDMIEKSAGTLDRVREAGQGVGRTLKVLSPRLITSSGAQVDPGTRDRYDSIFKTIANKFSGKPTRSIF